MFWGLPRFSTERTLRNHLLLFFCISYFVFRVLVDVGMGDIFGIAAINEYATLFGDGLFSLFTFNRDDQGTLYLSYICRLLAYLEANRYDGLWETRFAWMVLERDASMNKNRTRIHYPGVHIFMMDSAAIGLRTHKMSEFCTSLKCNCYDASGEWLLRSFDGHFKFGIKIFVSLTTLH